MNMFIFLLPLICIFLIGLIVISVTNNFSRQSLLNKLGFAYGIGVGCVTVQMMFYSFLHIGWNPFSILLPWFLLGVVTFIKKSKMQLQIILPSAKIDFLLLAGIICSSFFVLFEALIRPLSAWDGWSHWFLHGKAFYILGYIDPQYLISVNNAYPPLMNLLITFSYIVTGGIHEQAAIFLYAWFYVALLLIVGYMVSKQL